MPDCDLDVDKSMQLVDEFIALEQVINQIPSSQIGSRKTSSPLKSQTSHNLDSYQVSTQPSIIPSSQATPLSGIKLVLDFEDLSKKTNGNIKPPSIHSGLNQPFSNRSSYFKDKLVSHKSGDRFLTPNCKSNKSNIFTETSPLQESKLRIDTHMLSSPDVVSTPYNKRKELSQSFQISDFSKHTLYKTNSQGKPEAYANKSPRKANSAIKPKSSTKTSKYYIL